MASPRKRAGLWEMAREAGGEAQRIRSTQAAIARAGMQTSESQQRKAEVFEDIERLIYAIIPVRDKIHQILAPEIRAMAAAEAAKTEPEPDAQAQNDDDTDSD